MDNMNPMYGSNQVGYRDTRSPMPNTAQMMQQPVYAPPPKPSPTPVLRAPTYPPINGRTITTEQEITPRDIPMDGSVTYFPLADFSAIIGKYWDDTGTLRKMCFVRADESNQNGSENGVTLTWSWLNWRRSRRNFIIDRLILKSHTDLKRQPVSRVRRTQNEPHANEPDSNDIGNSYSSTTRPSAEPNGSGNDKGHTKWRFTTRRTNRQ